MPPGGDRGLCENGGPVYRIQEGDTLEEIASLNGTTVEQLLRCVWKEHSGGKAQHRQHSEGGGGVEKFTLEKVFRKRGAEL